MFDLPEPSCVDKVFCLRRNFKQRLYLFHRNGNGSYHNLALLTGVVFLHDSCTAY